MSLNHSQCLWKKVDTNLILCKQQGAVQWCRQFSDSVQALCGDRSVTSYKRQIHKRAASQRETQKGWTKSWSFSNNKGRDEVNKQWTSIHLRECIPFAPILSSFMWFKDLRRANKYLKNWTRCHTISDHKADFSKEISRVQIFQGSFCWLETMTKHNNTCNTINY